MLRMSLSRCGFTLIELILVIGIMSSVTLICALSADNFLSKTRLESSAQDVASTLRCARRYAITRRMEHRVVFDLERGRYWIEDREGNVVEKGKGLSKNVIFADPCLGKWGEEDGLVEFDDIDDDSISFYPQGAAETGSIYLQDKDSGRWYTITITGPTGCVRIYPEKH